MHIAVPPTPRSADLFVLGVWLLAGALPLVNAARQGWKKAARFSLLVLLGVAPLTLPYLFVVRANAVEVAEGRLHVQAGAGIVHDSDPEKEWDETMNKGRALFRAVAQAAGGL